MRLVIAEKPSVARSIAGVIGADQQKDGYMEGNDTTIKRKKEWKKFLPFWLFMLYYFCLQI